MRDLIQMLKEYEIKNIISVDDGWRIEEKLEEKIRNRGLEPDTALKDYCETYGIEIDAEEMVGYREYNYIPMKSIDSIKDIIPKTYTIICESLDVYIDASLKTLKTILDQLDGKINIYFGTEFKREYKTLEGNTLYILDKDMGEKRENEFLDYIVSITDERKSYNDLVIVYSNEVSELLEHDKKVKYLELNNNKRKDLEVLYQFWPLPKMVDENQLICGIKEMILKSMYGKALSKMIEMKRLSTEKAFKDLLHIDIDNLDDMIIESYIEGGKITESFELLVDSFIKRNELEQILESNVLNYEKGLLRYSAKRSKEIIDEKGILSKKKYTSLRDEVIEKKLRNSGTLLYNVADYSINKKYNNPSMGDIYVFVDAKSQKKYAGMLISQECSLVIRMESFPNGIKRKADDLLLLLFDIVEITSDNVKANIKNLDDCIWPIKIDEKKYMLKNLRRSMYVSPEILDLCGLNSSGKAKMHFEEESLEYKSVYSQEYYRGFKQILESKIESMVNQIIQTSEIENTESAVKNVIISLAYGVEFKEDFELQRICKIDEKQTLHIIHEYLNGIARIGLPVIPNL